MKKILTTTLAVLLTGSSFCQKEISEVKTGVNTLYVEAFGQGVHYSLNYDRLFNAEKRVKNSFSIGFVYKPNTLRMFSFSEGHHFGIPVSYNWLVGPKNHLIEFGVGLTNLVTTRYWNDPSTYYFCFLTPKFGYRYQSLNGGLFFRATLTPFVDIFNLKSFKNESGTLNSYSFFDNAAGTGLSVFPWLGLSVGYTIPNK